jgi:hypothetical protein
MRHAQRVGREVEVRASDRYAAQDPHLLTDSQPGWIVSGSPATDPHAASDAPIRPSPARVDETRLCGRLRRGGCTSIVGAAMPRHAATASPTPNGTAKAVDVNVDGRSAQRHQ